MANRKHHAILGAAVGAGGYALYSCAKKKEELSWPELLGAGLSGVIGAFLPDIIEPATSPNHRSFFHSIGFAGAAGVPAWLLAWRFRNERIRFAEECESRANAIGDGPEKISLEAQAFLHRFLAGALPGLILGYASHLAADATTPKGLPLLR